MGALVQHTLQRCPREARRPDAGSKHGRRCKLGLSAQPLGCSIRHIVHPAHRIGGACEKIGVQLQAYTKTKDDLAALQPSSSNPAALLVSKQ